MTTLSDELLADLKARLAGDGVTWSWLAERAGLTRPKVFAILKDLGAVQFGTRWVFPRPDRRDKSDRSLARPSVVTAPYVEGPLPVRRKSPTAGCG